MSVLISNPGNYEIAIDTDNDEAAAFQVLHDEVGNRTPLLTVSDTGVLTLYGALVASTSNGVLAINAAAGTDIVEFSDANDEVVASIDAAGVPRMRGVRLPTSALGTVYVIVQNGSLSFHIPGADASSLDEVP